jgi:hypothetical protein
MGAALRHFAGRFRTLTDRFCRVGCGKGQCANSSLFRRRNTLFCWARSHLDRHLKTGDWEVPSPPGNRFMAAELLPFVQVPPSHEGQAWEQSTQRMVSVMPWII